MNTTLLNGLIDFIVPSSCLYCCNNISGSLFLCPECRKLLEYADPEYIRTHYPSPSQYIDSLLTLYKFDKDKPIQAILHEIKYGNKFKLALLLGQEFAEKFTETISLLKIDGIVPVPLFHSKLAERGYNQSYYLAKGISRKSGIKVKDSLMKRTRFTGTQTMLSRGERIQNVAGAFKSIRKSKIESNIFLLVDDVLTTGSTIGECAKVLKDNGASKVIAGTIAIA